MTINCVLWTSDDQERLVSDSVLGNNTLRLDGNGLSFLRKAACHRNGEVFSGLAGIQASSRLSPTWEIPYVCMCTGHEQSRKLMVKSISELLSDWLFSSPKCTLPWYICIAGNFNQQSRNPPLKEMTSLWTAFIVKLTAGCRLDALRWRDARVHGHIGETTPTTYGELNG